MSLFGALSSGVSGLTSQSSAMGAVSDNITNVNTVGYKSTVVNFQTLVTAQTSTTLFSPGGVQSKPRQDTGVQGLLQASTSQTDISISGNGFFVVNEANKPTISNQFLYSRSGSFFQDNEGFLRNTAGFYLQAWNTDAAGKVISADTTANPIANQNVVSTDFLSTVNLSRVGGTASSTNQIDVGANLPSNDVAGATHKTDVQFFDSLGTANQMSIVYTKTIFDNQWRATIDPPGGTTVLTIKDKTVPTAKVYSSGGQLEFNVADAAGIGRRPSNGATVLVDGITYRFDTAGTAVDTATIKQINVSANSTTAQDVASFVAKVIEADTDYNTTNNRILVSPASATTVLFREDGTGSIAVDPVGLLDTTGTRITDQKTSFTVQRPDDDYNDYRQFTFDTTQPANGETLVINGTSYSFQSGEVADGTGANTIISTAGGNSAAGIALMLADLQAAIEATDPNFAVGGSRVRVEVRGSTAEPPSTSENTLILTSLAEATSGTYNAVFSANFDSTVTSPDGLQTYAAPAQAATTTAVATKSAIKFSSSGLPNEINVDEIEILDFSNGAANMDDDPNNTKRITLTVGTIGNADGFTQFGESFTPVFISQNGSRFGTFAGVTINTSGLVTALFDNGETRPVYQIPIATFTNTNGLESQTGNVWNATEASGDFTLRDADNGPAGQTVQSALEASTVDIGEEFTKMIVIQRAFSASAKIISTADEMLEELLRTKR